MVDKVPFIILIIFSVIVVAVVLINYGTQIQTAESGMEQKSRDDSEQNIVLVDGYCSKPDCIIDALKACQPGDSTVKQANNVTTIISIAGEDIYQGQDICMVSFYQENLPTGGANSTEGSTTFQVWSCKSPISQMSSLENDFQRVIEELVGTEHCARQVPWEIDFRPSIT